MVRARIDACIAQAQVHSQKVKKHPDADGLYVEVSGKCLYEMLRIVLCPLANRLWRGDRPSDCRLWSGELYSY
jgi:hypothetical protein